MYSIIDTSNANFYYRSLIFYYGQLQKKYFIFVHFAISENFIRLFFISRSDISSYQNILQ